MTTDKLQEAITRTKSGDRHPHKSSGGNQQNLETEIFEVSEKYYPKSELLGYRIPK